MRELGQPMQSPDECYEQACLQEAREPASRDPTQAGGVADLLTRLIREENRLAVRARLSRVESVRPELAALAQTRLPDTPASVAS